ncbi:MAG: hypothetical protein PHS46_00900 [Candidatus Omnitrophica bacterium]|nr:hypothetical protein [Candidatus Omnitrophota bacterium]
MADEKKEDMQKPKEVVQPPQTADAPAVAPIAKAAEPVKGAEPAKAEAKPVVKAEKPANCAACNKSIKNKRWYYRNGKFYCSKRCWQTASEKDKPAATPPVA